jgi:ribosome maturation factor RimP
MIEDQRIRELLDRHIAGTDIFVVEATIRPGNLILVEVDRPAGISIDECVEISRYLEKELDRDEEDFSLEVSSPGLGTPFKVRQQYHKNVGREVEVLLKDGTRIKGRLTSVSDGGITMVSQGKPVEIDFEEMKLTKTVVTFK